MPLVIQVMIGLLSVENMFMNSFAQNPSQISLTRSILNTLVRGGYMQIPLNMKSQ